MTKIIYIVHSTTIDNEAGVVSGQKECSLSPLGKSQSAHLALELKKVGLDFGDLFCSTLIRAQQTAHLIFPEQTIFYDKRLIEIDYGNLTHSKTSSIMFNRSKFINQSYDNGESYKEVESRIGAFLEEHKGKETITLISHQAPQLALEVLCKQISWEQAFSEDWRVKKQWQPFWIYHYFSSQLDPNQRVN